MNLKRLLMLLTLTLCALSPALFAQTPDSTPQTQSRQTAEEKEEARKELEKKALVMLDEIVGDARSLRVPENRIRILTGAADLLWPRDEKRARAIFREAVASINEAAGKAKVGDRERRSRAYWSVFQMRAETLKTIARRDAQLALEMLYATRQPPLSTSAEIPGGQFSDPELRLENQLIAQVVANDPKRALQMAEESLAKGFSFELIDLLRRLHAKDAEAGTTFAGDIIRKLRSERLPQNRMALDAALQLYNLTSGRQASFGLALASSDGGAGPAAKPLTLDAQMSRDLLEMLLTAALSGPPDLYMMYTLQSIMPDVERQMPERAPLARRKLAEHSKTLDPEARKWSQYEQVLQKDSSEALIEAAAKVPERMREAFYMRAAGLAMSKGDFERARQIVNDNLRDNPDRAQILESLNQTALVYALRKGKLDDARQLVSQIRSKEKRAAALAGLATIAATAGDKKMAGQLLDEARLLASERPKNIEQLNLHLQLARAYALVEPARSFEIVEVIVDRANDMIAAADVLDGFMGGPEIFRNGELVMHSGLASLEMIFQQYGKELATLARVDFDRTRSVAARFQRVEVRTMARLLIAQGLLSDRQPQELSPEALLGGGMMMRGGDEY
ncbi:MAG TPA: hypothetical protein VM934_14665 [Pyrinomonadaceae bacterium]|nr:hypothetical protein [Pyrinomonadaceae bacterium]